MKKYCVLALFAIHFCMQAAPVNDPIIAAIDGSMLNGAKIKNIINFLVELRQLLYGRKNSTTQLYEGVIAIKGKQYSIHELALIENECTQQDYQPCNCPVKKDDLTEALKQAKIIFDKAHATSQKDSKGTKSMSKRLIGVWSKNNNRTDSYLVTWADLPDDQEQASFNAAITSFVDFEIFLNDLISFLKDLVVSCPKAYQQYKQSFKKP